MSIQRLWTRRCRFPLVVSWFPFLTQSKRTVRLQVLANGADRHDETWSSGRKDATVVVHRRDGVNVESTFGLECK